MSIDLRKQFHGGSGCSFIYVSGGSLPCLPIWQSIYLSASLPNTRFQGNSTQTLMQIPFNLESSNEHTFIKKSIIFGNLQLRVYCNVCVCRSGWMNLFAFFCCCSCCCLQYNTYLKLFTFWRVILATQPTHNAMAIAKCIRTRE